MTDKRITELNEILAANLSDDDILALVDLDASETKKITKANLFANDKPYHFDTRADFLAATIPSSINKASWETNGNILEVIRDGSGTISQTDSTTWSPNGDAHPDHWAENTTPGTTDMTSAINSACSWGDLGCDLLASDYLISGPILITGKEPDENTFERFYFGGKGPGLSRIINSTPNTDWLTVSKGGALRTGWIMGMIEKVSFVSDTSNRPTNADEGAAIRLKRNLKTKIRDVEIDTSTYPIYQENCGLTEVNNLYVRNNLMASGENGHSLYTFAGGPGGRCFGQFWDTVESQAGNSWDKGFDIRGVDGLYITNSHVNNVADRIYINPTGAGGEDRCYQLHISNTYFDGNGLSETGDWLVVAPDMPDIDVDIPAADINASTDVLVAVGNGILDGAVVQLTTTGTLPGGLSTSTDYHVLSLGDNSFRLAASYDDWLTGTAIDITNQGSGTHTVLHTPNDTIRIMGIQMTGGHVRKGTNVMKFSGLLRGLESFDDVIVTGVEFQDFTGTWLSTNSAALTAPLDQVQNIKFTGNIFEDGPSNTSDNSNLFVITGKNISFVGNTVQGNWTNAGSFLYNILEDTDNVLIDNNLYDVPRTNALATVNASAGKIIGVWRSTANGDYILHSNGSMEAFHTLRLAYQSASVLWTDWTYPTSEAFLSDPTISGIVVARNGVTESDLTGLNVTFPTSSTARVRQSRVTGGADFLEGDYVDVALRVHGKYRL